MTLYRRQDQDHPHGKKCKKAKWLSGEALQIAVKRREAKGKGEKERYDLFSLEEKEERGKEENNTMGKTRDLFKKIGNIEVTFHAKMGMIKDRNGKDLTEAGGIKKQWQEYTEHLY